MDLPSFWVYVLYSSKDKKLYTGTTNNLIRRVKQHHDGQTKSTRWRQPLIILYCEGHRSIIDARRREKYFKTTRGRATLKMITRHSLDQLLKT